MSVSVVTPVNDHQVYAGLVESLSHCESNWEAIRVDGSASATKALNEGIEKASNDIVVCCHQDVRFAKGFLSSLKPKQTTGVVGTFGRDMNLNCAGRIYNPKPKLRSAGTLPCEAMSLDEHCLIFRRSSGLRFDEGLPYWHVYGADLCLTARELGKRNWIVDSMGLNHLSSKGTFDPTFEMAIKWLINKWSGRTYLRLFRTMCFEVDFQTGHYISYA